MHGVQFTLGDHHAAAYLSHLVWIPMDTTPRVHQERIVVVEYLAAHPRLRSHEIRCRRTHAWLNVAVESLRIQTPPYFGGDLALAAEVRIRGGQ